jgi:hypothetical protein
MTVVSTRTRQITTHFETDPLKWFGKEIDADRNPNIDVGGFIVPRDESAHLTLPGKRGIYNGGKEEACSKIGHEQKKHQSGEAGAARSAETHSLLPVGEYSVKQMLGELYTFYPGTRKVYSSPSFIGLIVPIGLFRGCAYRARIALEMPLGSMYDIRAWALREYPSGRLTMIPSHHKNPDGAMCTYSYLEWMPGRQSILDYMSFCVFWVAKALYERKFKHYPGPQHCPVIMRMERNRPGEFCGCGSDKRYKDCHRSYDRQMYPDVRASISRRERMNRQNYRNTLYQTDRSLKEPNWVRR